MKLWRYSWWQFAQLVTLWWKSEDSVLSTYTVANTCARYVTHFMVLHVAACYIVLQLHTLSLCNTCDGSIAEAKQVQPQYLGKNAMRIVWCTMHATKLIELPAISYHAVILSVDTSCHRNSPVIDKARQVPSFSKPAEPQQLLRPRSRLLWEGRGVISWVGNQPFLEYCWPRQ